MTENQIMEAKERNKNIKAKNNLNEQKKHLSESKSKRDSRSKTGGEKKKNKIQKVTERSKRDKEGAKEQGTGKKRIVIKLFRNILMEQKVNCSLKKQKPPWSHTASLFVLLLHFLF